MLARGCAAAAVAGCAGESGKLERMSAGAELAAVSSSLGELNRRVQRIISELSPVEEERYGSDLLEVERTLGVATRRLERLVSPRR
jgi:hypothetical protein